MTWTATAVLWPLLSKHLPGPSVSYISWFSWFLSWKRNAKRSWFVLSVKFPDFRFLSCFSCFPFFFEKKREIRGESYSIITVLYVPVYTTYRSKVKVVRIDLGTYSIRRHQPDHTWPCLRRQDLKTQDLTWRHVITHLTAHASSLLWYMTPSGYKYTHIYQYVCTHSVTAIPVKY